MPFTPFHFGIGFAAKAAVSRFSLALFIALQVIIDCESLYNLTYHRYPVHRFLHTFVGATLLAVAATASLVIAIRFWDRRAGRPAGPTRRLILPLAATAFVATWSHVLLDGIMHPDIRPFWPLTDANPLLEIISLSRLHLACLVAGFFGILALAFQWSLQDQNRS